MIRRRPLRGFWLSEKGSVSGVVGSEGVGFILGLQRWDTKVGFEVGQVDVGDHCQPFRQPSSTARILRQF
jgi:hypothetical protein